MFEEQALCDGVVALGSQTFLVSRMVLAAASSFFKAAFVSSMREGSDRTVRIDESLSPDAVKALLRAAHSPGGTINLAVANLEDLVVAADMLGFEAVQAAALQLLADSLEPSNVLDRLVLGERFSVPEMVDKCVRVIDSHFSELRESLVRLPVDCLALLLGDDELSVEETLLWEVLQAWIAHAPASRDAHFERLFCLLQLPELGLRALASLVYEQAVMASLPAREKVQEALGYLGATPSERTALSALLTRTRCRRLDVAFEADIQDVRVTENGKTIHRTGHAFFKGARGSMALCASCTWCLKILATGKAVHSGTYSVDHYAYSPLTFFVGIAQQTTPTDDESDTRKSAGKVGIDVIEPQVGDVIKLTTRPHRACLEYQIITIDDRAQVSPACSLPLQGTVPWLRSDAAVWVPFVQMNGSGSRISVV